MAKTEDSSSLEALGNRIQDGYAALKNRRAMVAAVLDDKESRVFTFGAAARNQIYEIGSVTKTFTANLLAQAVAEGGLRLSDPIPAEYQKPGATITYQQLATHTSGMIGGIFPGFQVSNPLFPFEGLTTSLFKELYGRTPLATAPGSQWAYSNVGTSLLGLILAEISNVSYEELVKKKILNVLGMAETYFELPEVARSRFPEGRMVDADGKVTAIPHWDLYKTAIDPAGGARSTIDDMVRYARAHLFPESTPQAVAVRLTQQKLFSPSNLPFGGNVWIGMNWMIQPNESIIWHNGQTLGFNAIVALSTKRKQAVVALTDSTVMIKNENGDAVFDTGLQDVAFKCLRG